MYLTTTLLTGLLLALTTTTTHAESKPPAKIGPWKCSLAADGSGMPQHAFCCDEKSIDRSYDNGKILVMGNCTAVPENQNVQCAQAADVWCCYAPTKKSDPSLADEWVCTSVAHWKPS